MSDVPIVFTSPDNFRGHYTEKIWENSALPPCELLPIIRIRQEWSSATTELRLSPDLVETLLDSILMGGIDQLLTGNCHHQYAARTQEVLNPNLPLPEQAEVKTRWTRYAGTFRNFSYGSLYHYRIENQGWLLLRVLFEIALANPSCLHRA